MTSMKSMSMKRWLAMFGVAGVLAVGVAFAQEGAAPVAPPEGQPAEHQAAPDEHAAVPSEHPVAAVEQPVVGEHAPAPAGEHAEAAPHAAHGEPAAEGAHGEGHHGPMSVPEFILHHVSDDESFDYELPLPFDDKGQAREISIHIASIFGAKPGEGLYVERTPGACSMPVAASFAPIPSVGKWLNGCWDLRPTKALLMIWIGIALMIIVLMLGNKRDANGVPRGLVTNIVETLVIYVRDEIAIPNIGKEHAGPYVPYLCTTFFLIMFVDYLGLVPGFFSGTGVLGVTIALATLTFLITQYAGIKSAGVVGYFGHLFGDVPLWMKPLMFIVETLGLFTKPFALLVRLFANMLAGHMVLFFLLALIFMLHWGAFILSVPMAAAIYALELFVAILQAYIFTLLSALFIGQGVALGHHAHHDEGHGHKEHAH